MKIISVNYDTAFEIPENFKMQVIKTNYMLKDKGEQSIPVVLPPTALNFRLINFGWRIDNAYKPSTDFDVIVNDGTFKKEAVLNVHSANIEDGISCTLYFDKSIFYSKVEDKMLVDISIPEIKAPNYASISHYDRVQYLIDLLKNEYRNGDGNIFTVFPVATDTDIERQFNDNGVTNTEKGKLVLNNFDTDNVSYGTYQNGEMILQDFEGEYEQTYIVDSTPITNPKGYGMTVFMNLYYVLEKMFATYGYTFDPITTMYNNWTAYHPVLLNNIADSVCRGRIVPNELLPNVKIKEFIDFVEKRFAGKFIINEQEKKVDFMYLDYWLDDYLGEDYTPYLTANLKMTETEFKKMDIKDSSNKNFVEDKSIEYIDAKFLHTQKYSIKVKSTVSPGEMYLSFNLFTVGSVINKYSNIIVDGKTTSESTDTSSDIMLVGARPTSGDYVMFNQLKIWYRCGFSSIDVFENNAVTSLKLKYQSYFDYLFFSNIKVETKIKLPIDKLMSMDITASNMYFGQELFFEEIKYILPHNNDEQKIILRTKRNYSW